MNYYDIEAGTCITIDNSTNYISVARGVGSGRRNMVAYSLSISNSQSLPHQDGDSDASSSCSYGQEFGYLVMGSAGKDVNQGGCHSATLPELRIDSISGHADASGADKCP